jgi:hypothetical protein
LLLVCAVVMSTNSRAEFYLGFFERADREPSQLLIFKDVGYGNSSFTRIYSFLHPTVCRYESRVQVEFTPILRAYVASDYQENAVLKGQISTNPLMKQDLAKLPDHSDWLLKYNPGNGKYEIIRDAARA